MIFNLLSFFFFFLCSCLDKFRLKFRELFSSCCCCCKSIERMKSASSAMIPFKVSSTIHHTTLQPSPLSATNSIRYHLNDNNNSSKRNTKNSLSISITSGHGLINNTTNNNSNHTNNTKRPTTINPYNHNGPITFRLTNV